MTNTPPPGAMGNNNQRGNCELPHKSIDKDWSLLGPCRPMAGVPIISLNQEKQAAANVDFGC